MPSLLGMMDLADNTPDDVEGTDLSAALLGKRCERPTSAFYLDTPAATPHMGARGLRTHRYTFVRVRHPDGPEDVFLYDNEDDPYQLNNIAAGSPGVTAELTRELDEWQTKAGEPPWD